jgi:hypothetical protein
MYIVTARVDSLDHFSFSVAVSNQNALYDYIYILGNSDYVKEFKVTYEDNLVQSKDFGWGYFSKWVTTFYSTDK